MANRSAALYHMKQYRLVLDDLKELHRVGSYPKNLLYKVAERKARCYLALEQRVCARNAFRYISPENGCILFYFFFIISMLYLWITVYRI